MAKRDNGYFWGTGRRKKAVAQVRLSAGEGKISVNRLSLEKCFPEEAQRIVIKQPLELTETFDKVNLLIRVNGGGKSGQAGAIRHGLARALMIFNESFRPALKKAGYLTRDSRMKERKKYGQPGARKKFQFSKR
ncbi:MAG: 30S ribosomal protein S9 [Candidatus Ratteibacteria bacterium]|nr:30S ribosomal protein S9 [Candidatus Ratteibacteria bacterium]